MKGKIMASEKSQEQETEQDTDSEEFAEGDYGFIIDSNGKLKSMMMPDELMEDPPLEVKKILKIFGIKDIHQLEPRTLH